MKYVHCTRVNAETKPKPRCAIDTYIPSQVGEAIGLDCGSILNDVNRSAEYCYFLVAVEFWFSYCFIRPLKRITAKAVAHELLNHILPMTGIPGVLVTDNGKEFCNKVIDSICKVLGLEQHQHKLPKNSTTSAIHGLCHCGRYCALAKS